MVFRDVIEKILVTGKAFQGKKWYCVNVIDIEIKIDLVDPFNQVIVFWSLFLGDEIELVIESSLFHFVGLLRIRRVAQPAQYPFKSLAFLCDGIGLPHMLKHSYSKAPWTVVRIDVINKIYFPIAVHVIPAGAHACV
jgi:hypothetical protein